MKQRRHTLLVVDDEVDVLDSLRHQFHRNYRVLTSASAPEAMALLENNDVEVLLTDQRMPEMTGDALLRQARRLKPDTIRILFTGYADIPAVISAVNEGQIFRYVLKPWDTAELEAIIRQGVEQYDLLSERRRLIGELRAANAALVEANGELARADRLKTAFIEVASHEFNTPITLVLGLAELMRMAQPDRPAPDREALRQITESGRQLARLVTNMLTLLRADDFRQTLQREPVALADLLEKAVQQVRPFLLARRIALATTIEDAEGPDGLGLEIDADKIAAVLVNLLTNAIKFTPDDGRIELSARPGPDDEALIAVEDHGIGIEAEDLPHLFQPFFTQFDPSRHSSGDFGFCKRGLGLGLSIARQFVEMHGGRIFAERVPTGGTRLTVALPRHGPARPAETAAERPPADTGVAKTHDVL